MAANRVTRRAYLILLASGTAVGLLAACGGGSQPATSAAPTTAAQPTAASAPAAAGAAPTAVNTAAAAAAPTTAAQPTAASAPAAIGPVKLRVAASWTTTGWKVVWEDLIKGYRALHPNVSVSLDQSSTSGQYDQKLFAEVAAGTLPDIIYTTDNYAVPFKQNHITQDMLPFAQQTKFPISDFKKIFLNLGMVDGQLHMLPVSGDVVILFINKRLVKEAGVTIPWNLDPATSKWTQNDFYQACQRMTVDVKGKRGNEAGFDKTNVSVYGAAMAIDWWAIYVPAIISEGGQLVSADLTKSLMDSKAGVAAFEWLTKPVLDGYWAPYSFLSSVNGPTGAFNGGKAAVTATVRGATPSIRPFIKDDWDVAHFYRGPVKRVTGMGTLGFGLSAKTKHPHTAWSFLAYMFGDQGMKVITSQYGATPVEKRFFNATWWKNLPPPPANNNVFTQAYDYGTLPPRLPFYTTGPFTKALTDGLQAIELKKATPKEVVSTVSAQLQKWLDQNNKKKA